MNTIDRFRGCISGLATGDAVGTTVEFSPRGSFTPLTGMVGGGPFRLKPGQWTDDTSMALCLAASLIEIGGFDPVDQMERYCRWYETGYLSSTGHCFDIGGTTRHALHRYRQTGDPFSGPGELSSGGNGSIMRLAPVPLFYFPDRQQMVHYAGESSRTTHGSPECIDACRLYGDILFRALSSESKENILFNEALAITAPKIRAIAQGAFRCKTIDQIRGSGYVVDSLEAALWCFWTTESFEQAILAAANLGDDADTSAAVCGQVAGAYYGIQGIPDDWLSRLAMKDEIIRLADGLYHLEEQ